MNYLGILKNKKGQEEGVVFIFVVLFMVGAFLLWMFSMALEAIGLPLKNLPAPLEETVNYAGLVLIILFGLLVIARTLNVSDLESNRIEFFILIKTAGWRKSLQALLIIFLTGVLFVWYVVMMIVGEPNSWYIRLIKILTGFPVFGFMIFVIIRLRRYLERPFNFLKNIFNR